MPTSTTTNTEFTLVLDSKTEFSERNYAQLKDMIESACFLNKVTGATTTPSTGPWWTAANATIPIPPLETVDVHFLTFFTAFIFKTMHAAGIQGFVSDLPIVQHFTFIYKPDFRKFERLPTSNICKLTFQKNVSSIVLTVSILRLDGSVLISRSKTVQLPPLL